MSKHKASSTTHGLSKKPSRLLMQALEPRIMFDAALGAAVADMAMEHPLTEAPDVRRVDAEPQAWLVREGQSQPIQSQQMAVPTGVLFIDGALPDHEKLAAAVQAGFQVIVLDAKRDGVHQITEVLGQYQNLQSVQIISDGHAGQLRLGTASLNEATLGRYQNDLAAWGKALSQDGDILLFGCKIAQGSRGEQLLQDISRLTQADIAASTDATGGVARNGNWILERQQGDIESKLAIADTVLRDYAYLLGSTGTADGTYDFTGTLGGTDSGGAGYKTFGDKFVVSNIFEQAPTAVSPHNVLYANNSTIGGSQTIVIKAENGSTCKTFTFDDMGLSCYAGTQTFTSLTLTLKNSSGSTIATLSQSSNNTVNTSIKQLSTMSWGSTFSSSGWDNVAWVELTFSLSGDDPLEINFEDITVSNVSAAVADTTPPTLTTTLSDSALKVGETAIVTFTFSEAVTGFSNADITVPNGTLTAVSSSDGGTTWTATFTPTSSIEDATNVIAVNMTGLTDTAGNAGVGTTNSGNFTIDTKRPTATITLSDSALRSGETATVTFTFSESVSGFTSADLTAPNGAISGLSSGDGGTTWTATFTPTASVEDTSNVITLDNTGVTDSAGNTGSGTTDSSNFTIDTKRPTATINLSDSNLSRNETAVVTFTFTEAVSGFANDDLIIDNGTLSSVSSSDGGVTWTATLTPTDLLVDASNSITIDLTGVLDAAGNAGTGSSSSSNYAIDTRALPTVSISMSDTSLAVGETATVTFTFSEAVTGFTNADLTIANGTLTAVSSADGGTTWTATFTPDANVEDSSNVISINMTGVTSVGSGLAGSGSSSSSNYSIDTKRPTATISLSDSNLQAGETATVTITFHEAVTGFNNADLTIANGTLSSVSSSDGGVTWTATFTPTASIEDATNVITLDNTGVTDALGNAGSGSTDSSNYTIDTKRPTVSISMNDSALSAGETTAVTFTFSEAVTGFTNADITIANGTLSSVSSSDGGVTWTATFTPDSNVEDSSNVITVDNTGVQDSAGNSGTGSTDSANYSIDNVRPTVSIKQSDTSLKVGDTSAITFTFSEAVTGFSNADVTVANATLSAVSSSDGGITWTATLTPTADIEDATNFITVDKSTLTDLAGNAGSGTTNSSNYKIDTKRPTATISMSDTALKVGDTSTVTFTFSEAVSGFTNADLTIANGTMSSVSSADGGTTWTATFTPASNIEDTSNVITLDLTGIADSFGNAGSGSTDSGNYTVDTKRPTVSISMSDTAVQIGDTPTVTFTFSEAVTGFTTADVLADNGTLSGLSSSDGGVTWTATFTPDSNVTSSTNLITVDNTGVVDGAGNAGSGTTDSANFTIDTLRPTVSSVALVGTPATNAASVSFTVTFAESVTGVDTADFQLTTTGNATGNIASISGSGTTYTVVVNTLAGVGTIRLDLKNSGTGISDSAGNAIATGYTSGGTHTVIRSDPPVISNLNGDSTTFVEDGSTVYLDSGTAMTLTDADSPNYNNGSLTVSITANADDDDYLLFANQGTGAGQIGYTGSDLTYGGVVIGSFTGGTLQNDLVFSFNSNATPDAVQALMRALQYRNLNSDKPATGTRTVSLTVDDGEGGVSTVTTTIAITPVNDAAVLTAGATLAYTENGSAAVIDNSITISDADDTQLTGATVTISTGLTSGDLLSFSNTANISGSYNSGTGVLTLTGTDTLANYRAALRSVQYSSSSEDPTATSASRTISWRVTDANSDGVGAATSTAVSSTINITAVNDAPVLTAGGTLAYTENASATVIDNSITLSDVDDGFMEGATINIASGFVVGDLLSFNNFGNITGSYNASKGVMFLSGVDTVANYQAALRSITFSSLSNDPTVDNTSNSRTINWQVDDANSDGMGAQISNQPSSTINVTAVNDAPVISAGNTLSYTENASASVIASGLTVSDVDDTHLNSAVVSISSGFTSGDVLAFSNTANISGSYNAATGVLTLTGTDTVSAYQSALRSITFVHNGDDPTSISSNRSISWQVTDANSDAVGAASNAPASSTITITAINDAPVLSAGATLAYTENGSASAIDSTISLSDADDSQMTGATISISSGFTSGDVLSFSNQNGISGSYNSATGVLTLSGTASVAHYQAALRSVQFHSTSDDPTVNNASRSISWQVTDANSDGVGAQNSNVPTSTINLSAVNDAPVISAPASISVTEDVASVLSGISFSDPDVRSNSMTVTLQVAAGTLEAVSSGGVTVSGSGSNSMTLSGTLSNLNSFIAANSVRYTTVLNANGTVNLSVGISDGGSTGSGGTLTASSNISLNIAAVNDAPTLSGPSTINMTEDVPRAIFGYHIADVDSGNNPITLTFVVASGSLTGSNTGGVTASGNGSSTLVLTGTASDLHAYVAQGYVIFTPVANAIGNVSLSATLNDGGHVGSGGSLTATVNSTLVIANVNDAPTGSLSISGTVAQGQTLTVLSSLNDVDGLGALSYQWQISSDGSNWSTLGTGGSVSLTQVEVGKFIRVVGTYVDGQGTTETVASLASAAVANVNDLPTGSVSIAGSATQNQTLTASHNLADIDGIGTVSYQWQVSSDGSNWSDLSSGDSLTLSQAEVGKYVRAVARYTDGYGTQEAVASLATTRVANINDAVNGSVTIGGSASQNQTLSVSNNLTDPDGMGTVSYQWQSSTDGSNWSNLGSGTTQALSQSEVGRFIRVIASYTDGQGTPETVISSPTSRVANVNDLPSGSVLINGTVRQGETLSASHTLSDLDGMGSVTYQWQLSSDGINWSNLASGPDLALGQAEVGKFIRVLASYTDQQGTAEQVASNASVAVANVNDLPTGSVLINGNATQGQVLNASASLSDLDGLGAISYQWQSSSDGTNWSDLSSGDSLSLTQTHVGQFIRVVARYTDGQGTAEQVASNATGRVANINDLPVGSVSISGTAGQGRTLSASHNLTDLDGLGTVSYQWQVSSDGSSWSDLASGDSLTLSQAEVGRQIRVLARYTDGFGTQEQVASSATGAVSNLNDAPTGSVSITGTAQQGQVLGISQNLDDADGMGALSYQWQVSSDGSNWINLSSGDTLSLTQAEVGQFVRVQARYTDGDGAQESVLSSATVRVSNINDLPLGSVTIGGSASQGQTLSASHNLSDLDGLGTISYQWQVSSDGNNWSNLSSGSELTLSQAEVGRLVRVVASYTDQHGTTEQVSSAATDRVANINDLPQGAVSINGTPRQGETLTASHALSDLDGLGNISYQWQVSSDGITWRDLASGDRLTLSQAEVGSLVRVIARYTDQQGTAESVTSQPSSRVADSNDLPTGNVLISGQLTQNQTLTVSNTLNDADGMGTVSYRWQSSRDGVNWSEVGSGDSLRLSQAEVGRLIRVVASYTDQSGTAEQVISANSDRVANVNDLPTGAVSIVGGGGRRTQGQTLVASDTLADIDGMGTVQYRWQSSIDGTTWTDVFAGDRLLLTQSEVGKFVRIVGRYTDGQGTVEEVASAASSRISNVNDLPVGTVTVSGNPTAGQTLTARNDLTDVDGMGVVSYSWQSSTDGITWTTFGSGEQIQLSANEIGKRVRSVATYTDGQGARETVNSSASEVVRIAPALLSASLPADGSYKAGDVLEFTVKANTTLSISEGSPQLALTIGGKPVIATLLSSSGDSMRFGYTVQAGDSGPIALSSLQSNGAKLQDAIGNPLNLTLQGVPPSNGILIDTQAPQISAVSLPDAANSTGGELHFTVSFNEEVRGVDVADFALAATGGVRGRISSVSSTDGRNFTVTVSDVSGAGRLGLALASNASISDRAGNALSGTLSSGSYQVLPPQTEQPQPKPEIQTSIILPTNSFNSAPNVVLDSLGGEQSTSQFGTNPLFNPRGDTGNPRFDEAASSNSNSNSNSFISAGNSSQSLPLQSRPDLGSINVASGQTISFTLPVNTFTARDDGAQLAITASTITSGGQRQPLPAWLRFDPVTGTFSGTPPAGAPATLELEVKARDSKGNEVTTKITIKIGTAGATTQSAELILSKPSLAAQFNRQGQGAFEQQRDALLGKAASKAMNGVKRA